MLCQIKRVIRQGFFGIGYYRIKLGTRMPVLIIQTLRRMWRVLAEVGLPAVVTMTLVGLALAGVTHA